jgi:putative DNA primase/helicase
MLSEKLRDERAGILRWAVEGCLLWQRDGLQPPTAVAAATQDYRGEMDVVGSFIDECCIHDLRAETPSSELYRRYSEWSQANSESPISKADFGARLAEKGFVPSRTKTGRFWRGLAIRDPDSLFSGPVDHEAIAQAQWDLVRRRADGVTG